MASIFSWFKKRNPLKQAADYPIKSNPKSQKELPLRTQSSNEKPYTSPNSSMRRSVSVPNEPNFARTSFRLNGVQRGFDRQKLNIVNENNSSSQKNRGSSFHNVYDYRYELSAKRLNPGEGERHPCISSAAEPRQIGMSSSAQNLTHRYSVPNGFIHLPQSNVAVRRKSDTMQGYVPKAVSLTNPTSVLFGIKHETAPFSKENLLMTRISIGQHRAPGPDIYLPEDNEKSNRRHTEIFKNSKNDHSHIKRQLVQQRSCPEGIVPLSLDGNFYFTSSLVRDVVKKERCHHTTLADENDTTLTDGESLPDNISDLSSEVRHQEGDDDAEDNGRYLSCNENTIVDSEHKDSTQNGSYCNSHDIICGSFHSNDATCGSFSSNDFDFGSMNHDDVTYKVLNIRDVICGSLNSDDVTNESLNADGNSFNSNDMNYNSLRSDNITGSSLSYDEGFDEEVASILRQYDEIVQSVSQD